MVGNIVHAFCLKLHLLNCIVLVLVLINHQFFKLSVFVWESVSDVVRESVGKEVDMKVGDYVDEKIPG